MCAASQCAAWPTRATGVPAHRMLQNAEAELTTCQTEYCWRLCTTAAVDSNQLQGELGYKLTSLSLKFAAGWGRSVRFSSALAL